MADRLLSLKDVAARNGTDLSVGLIEEVLTVAPELDTMLGRVIPGTSFKARIRQALPASPVFRPANRGTDVVSSVYGQKLVECFYLDAQFRIDQSVADAPEEGGRDLLLADEALGVLHQKLITVGNQFYNGTSADANGFSGLLANYDSTNLLVRAGGSTANSQASAWVVWNNIQGVHFTYGGNGNFVMPPWVLQQVQDSQSPSKAYMAYVSNLSGWLGLSFGHTKSAARIANINYATDNKGLTDALVAQTLSKFPLVIRNRLATEGKIFMNQATAYSLQASRSVTIFTSAGQGQPTGSMQIIGPMPTESNGIPIVVTESLTNTEAVV